MFVCVSRAALLCAAVGIATPALAQDVTVWIAGEPGKTEVYEELAADYEAENPEASIEIVTNSSDVFNPALIPALTSGEGPDLFTFGTGPGQPAALIEGGLVADLTPYYREYGWDTTIPENIENVTSSDGKLWAVGNEVESTMMFYNKALFEEVGIAVPSTWGEFEEAIAALKEAGYDTPIGLGGADKWPISHWQTMIFSRYAGPEGIDETMFGDGAWNDQAFLDATAKLQDMAESGYFGPYPVATGQAETLDAFWGGDLPMVFTGSFVIPNGLQVAGDRIDDYGVFHIPPFTDEQEIHPTEAIGSGWYINASSDVKDRAADFINFLFFNPESRQALIESGTIPIGPVEDILETADIPPLVSAAVALGEDGRENGAIPAYFDTLQPANMTTYVYDALQALLLGSMTPEQFVDGLQQEWEAAKAEGTTLEPGGIAD